MVEADLEEKTTHQKRSEEEGDLSLENETVLHTHDLINKRYSGDLEELREGYAKVSLRTNDEMVVDKEGLVHGGFIFCAADYAAMAAVNDRYVILSGAVSKFLSPVRVGDTVVFEAKTRHADGRRRDVNVIGYVFEVKVFEATLKTVILENHVLSLDLMNITDSASK